MDFSLIDLTNKSTGSGFTLESQKTVFRILPILKKKPNIRQGEGESLHRTRRPHKKSRAGCQDCKGRKIKCDEIKPECQRCLDHRILCEYKTSDVIRYVRKLPQDGTYGHQENPCRKQFNMSLDMAAASLNNILQSGEESMDLDNASVLEALTVSSVDLQVLHHFFSQTCFTVGSPLSQRVAQSDVVRIAICQPYLMHSVLAVSAAHYRRLYGDQPTHRLAEIYHWQQAIVLFQKVIGKPIKVEEMDAVLSTCMLLAALSCSTERFDPLSSWVYSSDPQAISWLQQQCGLKGLLEQLKEHLSESVSLPVFEDADDQFETYSDQRPGTVGLPQELVELCGLNSDCTVENNPYLAPVRLLTPLLALKGGIETFGKRISFMGRIRPCFFRLLQIKDPVALLIIAYWFGQMCGIGQWWILDRCRSECMANCKYLETIGDSRILHLLEVPAKDSGYNLRHIVERESPPIVVEISDD